MPPATDLQLTWLEPHQTLPPANMAWPGHAPYPGLLAAGGDLSVARLVDAYSRGIFPWFSEGEPILWWSTSPRMTLAPACFNLHTSLRKQLRALLTRDRLRIAVDEDFQHVVAQCANASRPGQGGTWIGLEMRQAYEALYNAGHAHCITAWIDGSCVGGLYGVAIGRMVYGESMFSLQSNGSKLALAALVALCKRENVPLIDCQQVTAHLASLGATAITRDAFLNTVEIACAQTAATWTFSKTDWTHLDARLA